MMAGIDVGVLVVALLTFLRSRERALLPVLALFALLAMAHSGLWPRWTPLWHVGAGLAGVAVVLAHAPHPTVRP